MKKLIYEVMFDKLIKIGIINSSGELNFKDHIKVKNSPYMDLNIDQLSPEKEGYYLPVRTIWQGIK